MGSYDDDRDTKPKSTGGDQDSRTPAPKPKRVGKASGKPIPGSGPLPKPSAPSGDWAPTRSEGTGSQSPSQARPSITTDPPHALQPSPLGGFHRQNYELQDVSRDASVKWTHTIDGVVQAKRGVRSALELFRDQAGETVIETTAAAIEKPGDEQRTYSGPTVRLQTEQSATEINDLHSQSPGRADVPVLDTFQLGEELIATVKTQAVDPSVANATAEFSGALEVKKIVNIGTQQFRLILKPQQLGRVAGNLSVAPRGVEHRQIKPARIELTVEAMRGRDDHGSRPKDASDAVDWIRAHWYQLYEVRLGGLSALMRQLAIKDPPPPTPMWKEFLVAAARIALHSATAGISDALSSGVMRLTGRESDAWQETLKVFGEEGMAGSVEAGAEHAYANPHERSGTMLTPSGTKLSIANYFELTQTQALLSAQVTHVTRAVTTARAMTERLETVRPGTGFRAAVEIARAIEAQTAAAADRQYRESLQAWCTLLAKVTLNTMQPAATATAPSDGSTNLRSMVDVDKIVLPGLRPGVDHVRGVLRLELGDRPQAGTGYSVKHAFIEGLDNDAVAEAIGKLPLRELKMPIIARYNTDENHGFVIGRNELGHYWAESKSLMLDMRSPEDGARKVFEDIGNYTVFPRRG